MDVDPRIVNALRDGARAGLSLEALVELAMHELGPSPISGPLADPVAEHLNEAFDLGLWDGTKIRIWYRDRDDASAPARMDRLLAKIADGKPRWDRRYAAEMIFQCDVPERLASAGTTCDYRIDQRLSIFPLLKRRKYWTVTCLGRFPDRTKATAGKTFSDRDAAIRWCLWKERCQHPDAFDYSQYTISQPGPDGLGIMRLGYRVTWKT